MVYVLFAALVLGFVSGLRVFTGPAVLHLMRGGIGGIVFAVLAIGEYVVDALPIVPARTTIFPSLVLRLISGGFMGYMVTAHAGMPWVFGIILGCAGALAGTFGGYRVRMALVAATGPVPAAVIEDVVAIAIAVGILFSIKSIALE